MTASTAATMTHGSGTHVGPAAGGRTLARFGRELRYLLAGLPVGVAAFTTAVTGVAAGAASAAVVLGLPVLVASLTAARAFARQERKRVAHVTGRVIAAPSYRAAGPPGVRGARRLRALRDPQSWRDLAHMLVSFPLRVAAFCVALTWTVGGLGELLYGGWSWAVPRDKGTTGLLDLMFGISSRTADVAFNTAVGAVLLATAIPVVRALAATQTALARALLTSP